MLELYIRKGQIFINQYEFFEDYVQGTCSDGTTFTFDLDDYSVVSTYNWFHHRDAIEGNKGKERISLGKLVGNRSQNGFPVLRIDKSKYDYRKANLYSENTYVDKDDYYEVWTNTNEFFMVDKEDYELTSQFRWYINTQKYPEAKKNGRRYLLHRLIMNAPEEFTYDQVVDHINRNTLDNRKSNLRIVTQKENASNSGMMSSNTSGVSNVYWHKEMNAWRFEKVKDGQHHTIAYYLDLNEAKEDVMRYNECQETGSTFVPNTSYKKRKSGSGHKYVYKHKPSGYTVAINGKYLGLFQSLDEAVNVRDKYIQQN